MRYNKKTVRDLDVRNKTVVLRLDLNVPIVNGKITDETRIDASMPIINYLLQQNAKVVILSHLGRINSYKDIEENKKTLRPIAINLKKRLRDTKVGFCTSLDFDVIKQIVSNHTKNGEVLLLENTRYFNVDPKTHIVTNLESSGSNVLGEFFASLGDVFIDDAFATAHRDHASNAKAALFQPNNGIGFLMEKEITTLENILDNPQRPYVAILGGAKVKDKIKVIYKLLETADKLIISGGMTYTFAKAMGYDVGISKVEDDLLDVARDILAKDKEHKIILADDYMAVKTFSDEPGVVVDIGSKDAAGLMGLDVGSKTEAKYAKALEGAKTVFWNGPLGVFEFNNFQHGTKALCEVLAKLTKEGAKTVIGGGDSASAAINFGYKDKVSFISTGGGASLAFISNAPMPGIENIDDKGLTPHISAARNKIAKVAVVCGDPLRAKWMAETYLQNPKLVSSVRAMYAYTGTYKGVEMTIMGHGMGMPSIGIYSYELFKFYDVDFIIRVGTAGSLKPEIHVKDILLANSVYSESNYANELGVQAKDHILLLNKSLIKLANDTAQENHIKILDANVYSSDCFYSKYKAKDLVAKNNCDAVEMEIFALYANAIKTNKKAMGLLTISDSLVAKEELSSIERQTALKDMGKLGLEIAWKFYKNSK